MVQDWNRYFIELTLDEASGLTRNRETEMRRRQAAHFIERMAHWLREESLHDKVSSLAITALGQVQITCEKDVITRMKRDDNMHIAAIRQSGLLSDNIQRIGWR